MTRSHVLCTLAPLQYYQTPRIALSVTFIAVHRAPIIYTSMDMRLTCACVNSSRSTIHWFQLQCRVLLLLQAVSSLRGTIQQMDKCSSMLSKLSPLLCQLELLFLMGQVLHMISALYQVSHDQLGAFITDAYNQVG